MMIEPGIERRKIERDTVYFTDNIGNPDYDTCVYWTVEFNQHLNFAWIIDSSRDYNRYRLDPS